MSGKISGRFKAITHSRKCCKCVPWSVYVLIPNNELWLLKRKKNLCTRDLLFLFLVFFFSFNNYCPLVYFYHVQIFYFKPRFIQQTKTLLKCANLWNVQDGLYTNTRPISALRSFTNDAFEKHINQYWQQSYLISSKHIIIWVVVPTPLSPTWRCNFFGLAHR